MARLAGSAARAPRSDAARSDAARQDAARPVTTQPARAAAPARIGSARPLRAASAPGRTDPFIDGYLAYLLARASHLISGEFHEQLAAQRVPVMHWRVFAALWDGAKTVREIAEISLQKQPTVSKLLERMERQALVARETDPQDRRRSLVSLTAQGRAVAGPLIDAARHHERTVLEPFGQANAATLVRMLQRLVDRRGRGRSPTGPG
jgi:DNA-binding MarR family transcriptional regulator